MALGQFPSENLALYIDVNSIIVFIRYNPQIITANGIVDDFSAHLLAYNGIDVYTGDVAYDPEIMEYTSKPVPR